MSRDPVMTPALSVLMQALADGDTEKLLAGIGGKGGVDINWRDLRGFTFLHFAAQRGNLLLCEALIRDKGADARLRNRFGEAPADTAAVFGHADLAARLKREMAARELLGGPLLPAVKSLAELRARGEKENRNLFYDYARARAFDQVVDAARATGERFQAQDLLGEGQAGDTTVFQLAATKQLGLLLDPRLWEGGDTLTRVWQTAPARNRPDENYEKLKQQMRRDAGLSGPAERSDLPVARQVQRPPTPRFKK